MYKSSCGLFLLHVQFIILCMNHLCHCPLRTIIQVWISTVKPPNTQFCLLDLYACPIFHAISDLCPSYKTMQHFICLSQFMLYFQIFNFCFQRSIFIKALFFSQCSEGYNSALRRVLKASHQVHKTLLFPIFQRFFFDSLFLRGPS